MEFVYASLVILINRNMKKGFLWLLLGLVLTSCNVHNTTECDHVTKTINVFVSAADWQYTNYEGSPFNNNYFYAVVDMPEITRSVFDRGEVTAYVVYDGNTSNACKHVLPYVRHYEEQLTGGTWNYYTETVDCLYGPGWVEFNYRASDFAYEDNVNINPLSMQFSIVITYDK